MVKKAADDNCVLCVRIMEEGETGSRYRALGYVVISNMEPITPFLGQMTRLNSTGSFCTKH